MSDLSMITIWTVCDEFHAHLERHCIRWADLGFNIGLASDEISHRSWELSQMLHEFSSVAFRNVLNVISDDPDAPQSWIDVAERSAIELALMLHAEERARIEERNERLD